MTINFDLYALACFALSLLHIFAAPFLQKKTFFHHTWRHYLIEIECIFLLWGVLLMLGMLLRQGVGTSLAYLGNISYTEPLFMVGMLLVCSTTAILDAAQYGVRRWANFFAKNTHASFACSYYFVVLAILPLLGSLITEVAAMVLAANMLRPYFKQASKPLQYATLAALCVNISVGGAITPFAAPPVLMVARPWGWDLAFMLQHFAWRVVFITVINALLLVYLFKKELKTIHLPHIYARMDLPGLLSAGLSFVFLIYHAHHLFGLIITLALFLFYASQSGMLERLPIKASILVGVFLLGLMLLGNAQAWWIAPYMETLTGIKAFFLSLGLSAVMDNAAITYLATLVPNTGIAFQYKVVAAALAAGGLTILANAPNLILVQTIQRVRQQSVNHLLWFLWALPATFVAILLFLI